MTDELSSATRPILAIIDSNIIHGRIAFEGKPWEQISDHQSAGRVELYFPEVVLKELTRHRSDAIREVTKQNINKFKKALDELKRSKATFDPVDFDALDGLVDVHMNAEYVMGRLREAVAEVGGTILPAPNVDAEHLASAAICRQKPFKTNGEGVGDYLIWRTVVGIAQSHPNREIYFVSNNYKDFSVSAKVRDKPNADLAKDLPGECQFSILGTLGMLNTLLNNRRDASRPSPDATEKTLGESAPAQVESSPQWEYDESDTSALDALVAKACLDYLDTDVMYQEVADTSYDRSSGIEVVGNKYPREFQNATISYIEGDPATVTWQRDEDFDGTTIIGTATVEGQIEFEGYMFKSDLALADASPEIHVSNSDHNRHMAEVTFESEFIAELGLRIEANGGPEITELMSITVGVD
ncbi:PIN domain-containing protein [Arthrobacter sp. 2RAF22]|uniref:PIN domain-containing protein n=1 Tax=Arthrobacter sp. 2RAF22 TaxID=3232996 RepID=UPI003F921931